jgi:hypothetical protein
MREEAAWSLLTPTPVCLYHPKSDAHIVYWHGVGMSRSSALILMCKIWGLSFPTLKMKTAALDEFTRAYYLGAFGTVDWESSFRGTTPAHYHNRLLSWMYRGKDGTALVEELKRCYTVQEALEWFCSDNERTLDD